MQSFLQRRRAGIEAQAQIDRDIGKARHSKAPNRPHDDGGRDLEKQSSTLQEEEKRESSLFETPGGTTSDPESSERWNIEGGGDDFGTTVERSQTARTGHSEGTALGRVLTGIHVRDRTGDEGHGGRVFVVGWAGPADPLDPHNWPIAKRIGVTLQISLIALFVGSASGIDATVLPQAARALGVSKVAESLATGLYLVGMGLGSLIAGPFSETFGRNAVYAASMAVFMIWIMASGLAPHFGAQITFRFLAGCSASTPLVCSGGSIADMYNRLEKTWSFPLYAITCFGGPMIGAVIGAYIGPSNAVSWRWVEWTTLISSGLVLVLVLLCMPETYGPLLLQWKAAHYRRITGDDRFRSEHEIVHATLFSRLKTSMTRPFLMLKEPIIIVMTLYISVVYIVLFIFLVGWPYIFEYTYGLNQGLANVIFISMFVGTQVNFLFVPFIYSKTAKRVKKDGNASFQPEIRLWYATSGAAISVPISLFWLGWTNYASISVWSAIFAVAVFGYGVTGIFMCVYMYIIDSYEIYSASALTFVALIRYMVAGGLTVVGLPFFEKMGTHYTLTILACISAVLAPIPYVLYYYGHWLRAKSRYAVSM
ncbi:major facilitator superfamily transporter [Colletotrichum orchidophilum]|uniref:Major facilitator superfamily transporter n=1 Tax=Colletotrichum orchidophilum TaxID=1209926 RepID=A0A1G4ANV3_9PEZI|nr:major facilitator superfamily transporter [Colletotrichum orchidophilum]OHE90837.1 major facilitator superfamily transporter [Colletotrichum orchidophilum]